MCVCVRYLSPVVESCYMLNVCVCVLFSYLSPVVEISYMLNVCVCVVSLSQLSSVLYVKCLVCVVSLSQPSSRELWYVKCLCVCCLVISAQYHYPLWDVLFLGWKMYQKRNPWKFQIKGKRLLLGFDNRSMTRRHLIEWSHRWPLVIFYTQLLHMQVITGHMLNVCECVVSLSQLSSRDLSYVKQL